MKIVILVSHFLPKWMGGVQIATCNIAQHLAARGHDVHIITSLDRGEPEESAENGVHIHRVPSSNLRFIGFAIFSIKATTILNAIDPQIIHAQTIPMGVCGFLAKIVSKTHYIVWGQGSDVYRPYPFKSLITTMVLRNADAVIALSDHMKKEMQRFSLRDISIIPNGIDLDRFEGAARDQARFKLKIKEADKVVLHVSTLASVKGVMYLIEAIAQLIQTEPKARLIVVGDGPERAKLELLVSDLGLSEFVTFAGRIQNNDVPIYMAASNVFVLPSLSEGIPIVILEAMAAGLPIVATNVGGISSLVEEGKNGFLIDPQNAEQIASKISLILADPALSGRMVRNNKGKAQQYTWASVVDRLEELYLDCAKAA
ncbi:MAG: glycosyltransferase family 4 protein [Halobacteriota archaeon]